MKNIRINHMIRIASQKDFQQISTLLYNTFIQYEPMCQIIKPTLLELAETFDGLVKLCCDYGTSVVIENNEEIVSALIAMPYIDYVNYKLPKTHYDKLHPIIIGFPEFIWT